MEVFKKDIHGIHNNNDRTKIIQKKEFSLT